MESALDVLSRAATMVQDNANETRITSKELPTAAWRRERRLRTADYHAHHYQVGLSANSTRASSPSLSPPPNAHVQHSANSSTSCSNAHTSIRSNSHHISAMMAAAAGVRPLTESTNHSTTSSSPQHSNLLDQVNFGQISCSQVLQQINGIQSDDVPLDMSVSNLKQRNSPPPPYREPLPGSQFASALARPSVITQAPPKRGFRDSATNRENDNRSCESIDEHFRRSLGNDYFSLFSKRSPISQSMKTLSPHPHNQQALTAHIRNPSPILHLTGVSTLPPHPALAQAELIPPPAYPLNLPSGNHQQNINQTQQKQIVAMTKPSNTLLSPEIIASQMKIPVCSNSPPSMVGRPNVPRNLQHTFASQNSPSLTISAALTSPQSPARTTSANLSSTMQSSRFDTSNSLTTSTLPLKQQSPTIVPTLSHLVSIETSPSSSPCHTPPKLNAPVANPSTNLPAIMRIKTEPELQIIKSNTPTPPASPTSAINHNIINNSACNPSKHFAKINNSSAEVLASVDDHFAKALGDTWKKLQENKEIRK